MEGLVMMDAFHPAAVGLGEPAGFLALPGRAALLSGPIFCRLFSFFMDFLKINSRFYLSYWLRLLLIVCGDLESNPGPCSDMRVRVLYSNIRGLHVNLDELAVAGSDYNVLVCAESKVSDRCNLSEPRVPGFGCPQQRLRNSTPGAQGMSLYVREGFRSFRQSKLEYS